MQSGWGSKQCRLQGTDSEYFSCVDLRGREWVTADYLTVPIYLVESEWWPNNVDHEDWSGWGPGDVDLTESEWKSWQYDLRNQGCPSVHQCRTEGKGMSEVLSVWALKDSSSHSVYWGAKSGFGSVDERATFHIWKTHYISIFLNIIFLET